MTDIQVLQLFRSYSEFVRQHRHGVVRKIDFFQPIRDPRIVGKRFLRNKRYPIVTEIESLQRQTIVQKPVSFVIQSFQFVVRKIQRSQRDETLKRSIGDVGEFIVRQIQRQQLQQSLESSSAHVRYPIVR